MEDLLNVMQESFNQFCYDAEKFIASIKEES